MIIFQLFALFTLKLCRSSVYDHARYCRLLQLCKFLELPVILWRLIKQTKKGTNLNSLTSSILSCHFLYYLTNYKMCWYFFFNYVFALFTLKFCRSSVYDNARYRRLLQLCKFLELQVIFWRVIKQTKKGTNLHSLTSFISSCLFLYCLTNCKMYWYFFFQLFALFTLKLCQSSVYYDHARYHKLLQLCKLLEFPVNLWRLMKQTWKCANLNLLASYVCLRQNDFLILP